MKRQGQQNGYELKKRELNIFTKILKHFRNADYPDPQ